MKTGQVQMFTYEAEQGNYCVQPYYSDADILEADAQHSGLAGSGPTTAGFGTDSAIGAQADMQPRELPEGTVFAASDVQMDMRSTLLQQEAQDGQSGNSAMAGFSGDALESPPILFYPDGTTSDAKLVLTNQHEQYYVVVSLRSLTGIAKVSGLVSAEEVQLVP